MLFFFFFFFQAEDGIRDFCLSRGLGDVYKRQVYIMGHTMLQTQPDGTEKIVFSVIGKKLTKTPPEGFYPIVIMTRVEFGDNGDNKYWFQTRANHSSAKTPLGMFDKFEIPNSLKLVDDAVRKYYKIQ